MLICSWKRAGHFWGTLTLYFCDLPATRTDRHIPAAGRSHLRSHAGHRYTAERHILDAGAPVLLVDLPDAFSEVSHRIVRAGREQDGQRLRDHVDALFFLHADHAQEHIVIGVDREAERAERIRRIHSSIS